MKVLGADKLFVEGAMRCVRCSVCVSGCPSYSVFQTEGDSPRGRVQLMRAVAAGTLEPDARFEQHMDNCLGCRACEDICPTGVPFGYLIDNTHAALQQTDHHRLRKLAVRFGLAILANRGAVTFVAWLLRVIQWLRLDRLVRLLVAPFSRASARRIDAIPRIEGTPFQLRDAPQTDDADVMMLGGCVMAGALGDVQRATIRSLEGSGYRVTTPPDQRCCGALHQHAGQREQAKQLARANLDAFSGTAEICVNSAGCALALKGYPQLLPDDPRAAAFAARIRDLSELVRHPLRPHSLRVAVQDSCHQRNIQHLGGATAAALTKLGVEVVALPKGAGCCGAAGLYSAINPAPAWALLHPLLDAVEESGCEIVVASNPGCLMFMRAGLRERESSVRVVHLAELLDPGDLR